MNAHSSRKDFLEGAYFVRQQIIQEWVKVLSSLEYDPVLKSFLPRDPQYSLFTGDYVLSFLKDFKIAEDLNVRR